MRAASRNDPCPCGSGKKFKKCCNGKESLRTDAGLQSLDRAIAEGLEHQRAGRLEAAAGIYGQVLQQDGGNINALHLLGLIALDAGEYEMALDLIGKAIGISPRTAMFHCNIGPVYLALNRIEDARASYLRAIELQPGYVEAYNRLGQLHEASSRFDQALDAFDKALANNPEFAESHFNKGNVLRKMNRLDDALASYRRAIAINPSFPDAHNNAGVTLVELGRNEEALEHYRMAIEQQPANAAAHNNLGAALRNLKRADSAMPHFLIALQIKPDYAEAYCNMGNLYKDMGRLEEAETSYRQALGLKPDYLDVYFNLGCTLEEMGRPNDAFASYQRAIEINPDYAAAHNNMAVLYREAGRMEESLASGLRALESNPGLAEAYINIGNALGGLGRVDEALASYHKAIAINPDHAEANNNIGNSLGRLGCVDDALQGYRKALQVNPLSPSAYSNMLLTMQYSDTIPAAELFAEHLRFAEQFEAPLRSTWRRHENPADPGKRLKVGYVSADFRNHAVAYFIEPILKCHDKSKFEIYCYYNSAIHDAVSERLHALADHWIPCKRMSDEQLSAQIRADGIDVLVDLSGHTAWNRLPVFARKPAPVQATWIGYAGTTGLSAMDYRLTDASLDPPGVTEAFHSERLVRLSASFIFQPDPQSPPVNPLPALSGAPLTFACLNNPTKITPGAIALWARILKAIPGSRMMLGNMYSAGMRQRFVELFAQGGAGEERLLLQPRCAMNEYLALHHQIDIALDSFPYNGGTTTTHALWMGVPVITLAGEKTVSRSGACMLSYAGLSGFVAGSEEDYLRIAVQAAADLPALAQIRQGLRGRIAANPASDPASFTREVEAAYRRMWQTWCEGAA